MCNQGTIELFCYAILLWRVVNSELTFDTMILQVVVEFVAQVFTTSIGSHLRQVDPRLLTTQPTLVLLEGGECLTFEFEKLKLGLTTKVVSEANVIIAAAQARGSCRFPEICVY
jgi:hypothetical protein